MAKNGAQKQTDQLDQMLKDACSRPGVAESIRVFGAATASSPTAQAVAAARPRFSTGANA